MNGATPGTSTAQSPKPLCVEVVANVATASASLAARSSVSGKVLHHARVGVERRERREILVAPRAKEQGVNR